MRVELWAMIALLVLALIGLVYTWRVDQYLVWLPSQNAWLTSSGHSSPDLAEAALFPSRRAAWSRAVLIRGEVRSLLPELLRD